jgi:hypothetical protein
MSKEQYPKHLANFCDYEMKSGIKGQSEIQTEEKLNNIINIFKCLNNKLIFQIEYAKKLSDRLLANRSQSIVAEKTLISKLKAEAGVTYVSRMTTMLQDLDNSKNIMDAFKNKTHRGSPNGIALSVQVLQHGAWEVDKLKFDKIDLPLFLNNVREEFNSFYQTRFKNHKLLWAFGLGNIEFKFLYLKKDYQSVSTLLQYLILRTLEKYESQEKLTVEKVSEILGYNLPVILNETNALIYHASFNPKRVNNVGIILSDLQDNSELKPSNQVWINPDFQHNFLKLTTIPTPFKVK